MRIDFSKLFRMSGLSEHPVAVRITAPLALQGRTPEEVMLLAWQRQEDSRVAYAFLSPSGTVLRQGEVLEVPVWEDDYAKILYQLCKLYIPEWELDILPEWREIFETHGRALESANSSAVTAATARASVGATSNAF